MAKKTDKNFSNELIKILTKTVKNKIYGSVEIFFEAGNITQITQRIIRKIQKTAPKTQISSEKVTKSKKFSEPETETAPNSSIT